MHSDLAVRLVVAAVPEGSFCAAQGSRWLLAAVEHVIVCLAPIEGRVDLAIQVGSALEPAPHAHAQVTPIGVLTQVRVCCDTPQEASVADALASFGVVRADMPLTLANIWLAIQGPACSEGPARQCFPLIRQT